MPYFVYHYNTWQLVVYPAAGLVRYYRGNKLVVINKGELGADVGADLTINGAIGEVLSQL